MECFPEEAGFEFSIQSSESCLRERVSREDGRLDQIPFFRGKTALVRVIYEHVQFLPNQKSFHQFFFLQNLENVVIIGGQVENW